MIGARLALICLLAQAPSATAPLGRPSAFGADQPAVDVAPALTRLYRIADRRSEVIRTLDVRTAVTVLEERGPWVRVQSGAIVGWWFRDADGPEDDANGRLGATPVAIDPERRSRRVELAEDLLGGTLRAGSSVDWLTDVHPEATLMRRLEAVAGCLENAYRRRYGVTPAAATARPLVVLFAREEGYRRYTEELAELGGLQTGGHAADGVAVLYAGSRLSDDVAATLAHELTHLLNARAFPFVLPAWLEEGTAEDFALAAAASGGCPRPGGWPRVERWEREFPAGGETVLEHRAVASGALRAVACAAERWRSGASSPELERLVSMTWLEMTDPPERAERYAAAVSLVRYLLGGGGQAVANEFRDALANASAGGALTLGPVLARLGVGWSELERRTLHFVAGSIQADACELHLAP